MPNRSNFEREIAAAQPPVGVDELHQLGIGRGALSGSSWRRVARGLYSPALDGVTTTQRIVDAAAQLPPGAAVGCWAAGYAWGVDTLDGIDPRTGKEIRVDGVGEFKRSSTDQLRYRRSGLAAGEVIDRYGVPVTSVGRTALDGSCWAPSLEEAVAFLDELLAAKLLTTDELRIGAGQAPPRRGLRQAIRAAELAAPGVRSSWESRLRMCYRLEARLPKPYVNVPIFSITEDFLGIADLFDPVAGLVTEFDGGQHRDRRQHHDDNVREEGFEAANLSVVRTDSLDLNLELTGDRRPLVRRLRAGYRRGMTRDPRRDRWTMIIPEWWRGRIPGCDI